MVNRFLVFESNRYVVYYDDGNNIFREEYHSKEEALSKYESDLIAVENNDPRIISIREKYLSDQLNDDFLSNYPNPLDDDAVCKKIIKHLFTDDKFDSIRTMRLEEDEKQKFTPSTYEIECLANLKLLKAILNNLDVLKKYYHCLNKPIADSLFAIKDDDNKLLEVIKKMLELYSKSFEDGLYVRNSGNHDLFDIYQHLLNFREEHTGAYDTETTRHGYEQRIYLNCHNEAVLAQFLSEYAIECITHNIDYESKGMFNSRNDKSADTTILYSLNSEMKTRIQIIEKIMNNHPEWRNEFLPPVYCTSKIGTGFYGVSHIGMYMQTFNDYFNDICRFSNYSLLAEYLINNNMIPKNHQHYSKIVKFAHLSDIVPSNVGVAMAKIEDLELAYLLPILEKFLEDPAVKNAMVSTNVEAFKNKVTKLHANIQGLDEGLNIPITINKKMIEHFGYRKKEKKSIYVTKEKTIMPSQKEEHKKSSDRIENNNTNLAIESKRILNTLNDDLNSDGYVTIIEVIKNLSKKLTNYLLLSNNGEEKDKMSRIIVELDTMIKRGKFDIELIERIKDFEHNYKDFSKVNGLYSLSELSKELIESNRTNKGIPASEDMYKQSAIDLFYKHYEFYKNIFDRMLSNKVQMPKSYEDYSASLISVFERIKGINAKKFDMHKYELFRNVMQELETLLVKVVNESLQAKEDTNINQNNDTNNYFSMR